MPTLTTLANVKSALNIQNTADDARITALCDSVTTDVQRYCTRTFFQATYTELLDGQAAEKIGLRETPVGTSPAFSLWLSTAVPRVYDATTLLIEGTHYYVDPALGLVTRLGNLTWPAGPAVIKVTYQAGYATIPTDLERAVIQVIQVQLYKAKYRRYDVEVENRGDGSVTFGQDNEGGRFDWPLHSLRVFDRYRTGRLAA